MRVRRYLGFHGRWWGDADYLIELNRQRTSGLVAKDLTPKVEVVEEPEFTIEEVNLDVDLQAVAAARTKRRRKKLSRIVQKWL